MTCSFRGRSSGSGCCSPSPCGLLPTSRPAATPRSGSVSPRLPRMPPASASSPRRPPTTMVPPSVRYRPASSAGVLFVLCACASGRPKRSAWHHGVRCADRLEPVRRASSMLSHSSGSPPSSSPGSPARTSTVRLWTPPATPLCPPSTRSPVSASELRILVRRRRQLGRWWKSTCGGGFGEH